LFLCLCLCLCLFVCLVVCWSWNKTGKKQHKSNQASAPSISKHQQQKKPRERKQSNQAKKSWGQIRSVEKICWFRSSHLKIKQGQVRSVQLSFWIRFDSSQVSLKYLLIQIKSFEIKIRSGQLCWKGKNNWKFWFNPFKISVQLKDHFRASEKTSCLYCDRFLAVYPRGLLGRAGPRYLIQKKGKERPFKLLLLLLLIRKRKKKNNHKRVC